MKKVSLIGDSIRLGYQDTVRDQLSVKADVWSPEGNCMHSVHHLFNLSWYLEPRADVIHFNCGLWDCRRLGPGNSENAIPVDLYVRNLDFLFSRVREQTQATLIWATVTPVVQSRYNARFTLASDPSRNAGDCALYNEAAQPILEKHGILVNDLYAYVMEQGVEDMVGDDGIHFNADASQMLGQRVAEVIQAHL
jgi:lysophospholipase L1-like esterase